MCFNLFEIKIFFNNLKFPDNEKFNFFTALCIASYCCIAR